MVAEFDAVVNYDRMISALVVLACSRIGLGEAPGRMILDALENNVHRIRTAHGVLDKEYLEEILERIFGTGLGSGGPPHFLLTVSEVLLRCIDSKMYGINVSNLAGTIHSEQNKDAFVDDSGLTVDYRRGDVVNRLMHNSQMHENTSMSVGVI